MKGNVIKPGIGFGCWMSLLVVVLAFVGSGSAQSQGRIHVSSTVSVFNVLPADTALAKRGDAASYAGHAMLSGSGFTAEVWYGPLGSRECDLILLPGSRTSFKTGGAAGQVVDVLNLVVPGATAGSRVRLQLRVWSNQGGAVTSWAQATASSTVPHGSSSPFDSAVLGGNIIFPTPGLAGLQRFNIHVGDKFFLPPFISRQPASRTECSGGQAMFRVEAGGESPMSFQWFKNGVALAGQTTSTLFVPATPSDNGSSYFVDVMNGVCDVRSATAVLTVDSTFNFFSSFNQGIGAAGATSSGNAGWQSTGGAGGTGALGLVGADNNLTGWYSISPFFNAPVQQFQVSFKSFIGFNGSTPAEGFSVNVSPSTAAVSPLPSGHEGQTDGLTISFDTFNTGGANPPEAPAIDIKYQGRVIATEAITLALNRFADVAISMSPDGRVDVSYDGQLIHKAVSIADYKPVRSFFNLGAATGGSNFARYLVDDLCITAASNSLPTITSPGNQTLSEDSATGQLPFVVADAETSSSSLIVTARSSNTALIPDSSIVLGSGPNSRLVQITPLPDRSGVALITLNVADAQGGSRETNFTVTVSAVNDRPLISAIADQMTDEDVPLGPIAFTISDAETPATSLSIGFFSSNTTLVPISAIVLGGSGTNRTLVITPAAELAGRSLITVVVSDPGIESSRSESFLMTVLPVNDPPQIKAIGDVTIPEDTTLGPIVFTVNDPDSAVAGVTLRATTSNAGLIPLSRILFGGSSSTRDVTLTPMTNQVGSSLITVIATDAGGASSQESFTVTVTNVNDAPLISPIADQSIAEDAVLGPLGFTISDLETAAASLSLIVTASSNTTLIPINGVVLGGAGSNRTVRVTPAAGLSGRSLITLRVGDGTAFAFESFLVTVNAVNDPPTITGIADQTISEDGSTAALPIIVGDAETGASFLTLTALSTNLTLVPLTGVTFGGSGSNRTVTVKPAAGLAGVSLITVRVSDGTNAVSEPFLVQVTAVNDPPAISQIVDQSIAEDGTNGPIAFIVSDPETPATALALTVESTNTALVPISGIVLGGAGTNRTITLTPRANQFGSTLITLRVSDGALSSIEQFVLLVRAVNDAPSISSLADTSVLQDEVLGPISFLVGDLESPADSLELFGFSSDVGILPSSGFVFGGAGSNRTVTLTPAAGRSGIVTVTLSVQDPGERTVEGRFVLTVRPRLCVDTSRGTNFWLTFPGNFGPDPVNLKALSLAITGPPRTRVVVRIPGLGFQRSLPLDSEGGARVSLPSDAELGDANDRVGNLGIQVTAEALVSVTAFHEQPFTQDAFSVFPVDVLGRSHVVMAHGSLSDEGPGSEGSQFALVATQDGTSVRIAPSVAAGGRPAGEPFVITLNQGETYQLRCAVPGRLDLSGTLVDADQPVAVFGGSQCGVAPRAGLFFCNYVTEPVPPVNVAGTEFITTPLMTRRADTFRVLGTVGSTRVFSNGVTVATLGRGQLFEMSAASSLRITSSQPVHVAQLAHSSDADGVDLADPTLILLPPVGRWLDEHVVRVPDNGMSHFLNALAPGGNTQVVIRLDGVPLPLVNVVGGSFSLARVALTPGVHRIQGTAPVAAQLYGWGLWDAYGYCAGMRLEPSRAPDVQFLRSIVTTASALCTAVVPEVLLTFLDDCTPTRNLIRSAQVPAPGTPVGVGTHRITNRVTDADGNTAVCETVLTVRPLGPVTIRCSTNIVVSGAVAGGGAVVQFSATASTACNSNLPTVCSPPSGSVFPVGVTTVTCSLADTNLNSSRCSFTVTVVDPPKPPEIIDPTLEDGSLVFGVRTQAGVDYALETKTDLNISPWTPVQSFRGDGNPFIFRLRLRPEVRGEFYRYRRLP